MNKKERERESEKNEHSVVIAGTFVFLFLFVTFFIISSKHSSYRFGFLFFCAQGILSNRQIYSMKIYTYMYDTYYEWKCSSIR